MYIKYNCIKFAQMTESTRKPQEQADQAQNRKKQASGKKSNIFCRLRVLSFIFGLSDPSDTLVFDERIVIQFRNGSSGHMGACCCINSQGERECNLEKDGGG